ncbi:hypothetical protein JSY14_09310 [Brachybacterium sp. EF45031]|uniref:hypothetical protein n=1 Tax=Brachybacterium sillae TaxID=2810536 RepID=UPI00217CEAD2|nr:hypothetical protein [Brachybacterium sillae]MCS6712211.1 hypothetical protein [Brachybacterium sillae]
MVRVFIPLLVAVAVGAVVAYLSVYPYLLPPLDGVLPPGYGIATTALPVVAAGVITLASAVIQTAALRQWRPR